MRLFGFDITVERAKQAPPMQAVHYPGRTWSFDFFGGAWQRNLTYTDKKDLLSFSAVYACVAMISNDVSKLRPTLRRRTASGNWVEVEHPQYSPILRRPNPYQSWSQFIAQWVASKLTSGNAYILRGLAESTPSSLINYQLFPLNPDRVTTLVTDSGGICYQLGSDSISGVGPEGLVVPATVMIHDRSTPLYHPLVGVAPLYAAAASSSQGKNIQDDAATFFRNRSRPSGHLTAPGKIDDSTAERLKRDFHDGFSGENLGRLLVTGSDLKFQPFTVPADQAQLIEQLKFTVEDVARAFSMPLYKIAAGQTPPATNVSALNLEYYQQTLQPHIESIEQLLDIGLKLPPDLMIEFDLDGLLRMDPKTRAEVTEICTRSGVMSPNEARMAWNLPPVAGGDVPFLQEQNWPISQLVNRKDRNTGTDEKLLRIEERLKILSGATDRLTWRDSVRARLIEKSNPEEPDAG